MYTTQHYQAEIPVSEYLEKFVDVPTFLEECKVCPNYGQVWSCPPYDFDVMKYWNKYQTLRVFAVKIIFDEEVRSRSYSKEELNEILKNTLPPIKKQLSQKMAALEAEYPESISLSSGSCSECSGGCAKAKNQPCRFPETMRYSIEALGGNVGLTASKLLGIHLEWMENGKLPHHFVLVSGLLMK